MSSWLASLPHEIPFRAASAAQRIDARTIEGVFVCTANDALAESAPPPTLLFEAMAQLGGGLAFDEPGRHGFLSGIDRATIDDPPVAGDRILIRVTLEADFGGIFRFQGSASRAGVEFGRARFYLARSAE